MPTFCKGDASTMTIMGVAVRRGATATRQRLLPPLRFPKLGRWSVLASPQPNIPACSLLCARPIRHDRDDGRAWFSSSSNTTTAPPPPSEEVMVKPYSPSPIPIHAETTALFVVVTNNNRAEAMMYLLQNTMIFLSILRWNVFSCVYVCVCFVPIYFEIVSRKNV